MKFVFDPTNGLAMRDSEAEEFAKRAVADNQSVCVANACVWNFLRATMLKIPLSDRPEVEWYIGNRRILVDADMRSEDFNEDCLWVEDKALGGLLFGENFQKSS